MIGGRSDQMVLLPCVSPGSARTSWTRNIRRAPDRLLVATAPGSRTSVYGAGS
jgi:hypothetical protein